METIEIMKIPNRYGKDLDSCYKNVFSGQQVLDKFYEVGIWKENYIPKELKDSNWVPDTNKKYTCWWYNTNPPDTSDYGQDILFYIEEYVEHKEFVSSGCEAIFKERQSEYYNKYNKNKSIENLICESAAYVTGRHRFLSNHLSYYKSEDLTIDCLREDLVKAGALIAEAIDKIDKIDKGETIELE